MTKFKLRIFQSCRSKDPSTLPMIPAFQPHKMFTTPPSSTTTKHRSSFKSHVSSAFNCGSKSTHLSDSEDYFQWQEDDQWHVVAKIYDVEVESPRQKIYNSSISGDDTDGADDGFDFPLLQLPPLVKSKRRRGRRVKLNKFNKLRYVSNGCDLISDGEKEKKEEMETLISSSRSFSTDSSTDFNPQLETIRESACLSRALQRKERASLPKHINDAGMSPEWGAPARLSVFKKLIPCKVEGKMKESFAVEKRSEDPYDDFKRSMVEMIMEKEMFEEKDLEQLLQCFLSLNSRFHHGVIVDAFSEIWDTMFGGCGGE